VLRTGPPEGGAFFHAQTTRATARRCTIVVLETLHDLRFPVPQLSQEVAAAKRNCQWNRRVI
jgi:hypothetical protein